LFEFRGLEEEFGGDTPARLRVGTEEEYTTVNVLSAIEKKKKGKERFHRKRGKEFLRVGAEMRRGPDAEKGKSSRART